jgi:hypothetical protein
LVDMVILLESGLDEALLQHAISLTFQRRKTHEIPKQLELPPPSWHGPFAAMARDCGLNATANEAAQQVAKYLTRTNIL